MNKKRNSIFPLVFSLLLISCSKSEEASITPSDKLFDEVFVEGQAGTLGLAQLYGDISHIMKRNEWERFYPYLAQEYKKLITEKYFLSKIKSSQFSVNAVSILKAKSVGSAGYMIASFDIYINGENKQIIDVFFLTKDTEGNWRFENFPILDEGGLEYGGTFPKGFYVR